MMHNNFSNEPVAIANFDLLHKPHKRLPPSAQVNIR